MTKCGTFPVATTTCSGEDAFKRVCSTTAGRFRAVCEAEVLGRAHHVRILPQGFQVPPRLNAWLCSSGGRDPLIPSCLASFLGLPASGRLVWVPGFFRPFWRRLSPFHSRRSPPIRDARLSVGSTRPPTRRTSEPFAPLGLVRSRPRQASPAPTIGSSPRGPDPGMRGRH